MAGNSPEDEKKPPVTVARMVKIKKSDECGEYVVFKWELFDNEESIRQTYFEYISATQVEDESLVEQKATKFFALTHLSASKVYEKVQQKQRKLDRKNARAIR